ncbi:MAG TPA: tripartite tricarboxylate transporter TctB family protein [Beijerinckiaceae bacterium]|nr:tripartite tricarboxylate transporter TctB family protein [Beijerinckiaceae bacterium]
MSAEHGMKIEEPASPASDDRAVVASRNVEIVVSLMLMALAAVLGWDNWRLGAGWASDGPQAGYFPFYLSVMLGAASLYGLFVAMRQRALAEQPFVTRDQFRRVLQVLVPTFLFVLLTALLGLYVASFILVAGFMWFIGKIAAWKSLLAAFIFVAVMFVTFDVAFDVIMPKGPLEAAFGR